jgi:ABC-type sugar transport system permease subunit
MMRNHEAAASSQRAVTAVQRNGVRRWLRQYEWTAYLYLLPAAVLFGTFSLWPMVFGLWISLWKWGIVPERFVGLDNYVRIFTKELFRPDLQEIGLRVKSATVCW